jgi:hypothetical protein
MNQRSPMKAIRLKCLDCCCEQYDEVKTCSALDCPLWMFRLGINPNCGDNQLNPFLQRSFFEKMHNRTAKDVINLLEKGKPKEE